MACELYLNKAAFKNTRVTNCSSLPRTSLVLALKVPYTRKPLSPGEIWTVGHPTQDLAA